jgi:hypothetical protein
MTSKVKGLAWLVLIALLLCCAYQLGAHIGFASCQQSECDENSWWWYDGGDGHYKYDLSNAHTARSMAPIQGTRTASKVESVQKWVKCTANRGSCLAVGSVAFEYYYAFPEPTNCTKDLVYFRYYCGDINGIGKAGSWNEGKDKYGK